MKKVLLILVPIVAVSAGWFAWWTISPLFIDREVQDELDPQLKARLEAQRKIDEQKQNSNPESDVEDSQETVPQVDENGVLTLGPFSVTGTTLHPAEGSVEIIQSPEETLLHYIDYDGTNGPDLYVYLSKDLEAKEIIDLGPQRGNKGSVIYGIPLDADLSEYKYVLTWCKSFGVLFDYAEIK